MGQLKKIFAIILAAVFLFSGCNSGNSSLGISEEIITDTEILKIKLIEETSEKIALEIKNESKNEIGYDEIYTIEFEKEGEWHRLEPKNEETFIEVAYVLEKENACTWGDNISRIYGKLPEGRYRIVKHFSIYEKGGAEAERITIAQQFIIG